MKTRFVLATTQSEPVQELLLSLEKYGYDEATIMLTLPNGSKVPLVGVATNAEGKLEAVRWGGPTVDYVNRGAHNGGRIYDRYGVQCKPIL